MLVGGSRHNEIHVVCLDEHFECLAHVRALFAVAVAHGVDGDIQHRLLPTLLPVVYPSYHRHEIVYSYTVDESVLTMKLHRLRIMLAEEVEGVHQRVVVAE